MHPAFTNKYTSSVANFPVQYHRLPLLSFFILSFNVAFLDRLHSAFIQGCIELVGVFTHGSCIAVFQYQPMLTLNVSMCLYGFLLPCLVTFIAAVTFLFASQIASSDTVDKSSLLGSGSFTHVTLVVTHVNQANHS